MAAAPSRWAAAGPPPAVQARPLGPHGICHSCGRLGAVQETQGHRAGASGWAAGRAGAGQAVGAGGGWRHSRPSHPCQRGLTDEFCL